MSKSQEWTERLNAVMPWGSSTCSKAPKYLPEEPGVIVRGKGCRVWDADGREFIDFRNGLGPVTLGYGFPATDKAIRGQLRNGVVFGHPHPLECEVAEMLRDIIPCAEQARFLKTGGEAIAACVRLARHHTGRDHVIHVGYNGWLNSLSADAAVLPGRKSNGAPPGVPASVAAMHHAGRWNDLDHLRELFQRLKGKVAAVVIAADYRGMAAGETFYPAVRKLVDDNGALLVFDEIVTGFRIALAGVQERFQVKPDLAVFAKGMANGMPLSVYVGRAEVMRACQEAIVSSTYGGESLSLAAAKAAVTTYREREVVKHFWKMGERMWGGLNRLCEEKGFPLKAEGFWPCPALVFDDTTGKLGERFFRAAYRNGVSLYDVSYVNFSHKAPDIDEALARLEKALEEI